MTSTSGTLSPATRSAGWVGVTGYQRGIRYVNRFTETVGAGEETCEVFDGVENGVLFLRPVTH